MNIWTYVIDIALILVVLLQIQEKPLTVRLLLRPIIIVAIAVALYYNGIPTHGDNLIAILILLLLGLAFGLGAGLATHVHNDAGTVFVQAGVIAAILWVTGMGLRFAFVLWAYHGGGHQLFDFSRNHDLTVAVWTPALLAMAVAEVLGRTLVLVTRRQNLSGPGPVASPAAS